MKNPKKVSKEELKSYLFLSIDYNDEAIDYVQNEISKYENFVKYNEEDFVSKDTLHVLRYMEFSLKFLDRSYNLALKELGV